MIRRPPRSTQSRSSAASDVYKRQGGPRPRRDIHAGAELLGAGVPGRREGHRAVRSRPRGRKRYSRMRLHKARGHREDRSARRGLLLLLRGYRLLPEGARERVPRLLLRPGHREACLLYTSDAADDLLCVDLGGRRIIKNKKKKI